ncbi:hypothetical protein GGR52DRAFT_374123 [Hypoxylon sp. FL1284]|nr:hypothetical protein GGR52DRAFT_374123 [Hypoxylon sp. FL1284]
MRFSIVALTWLTLAGHALGVPRRVPSNTTARVENAAGLTQEQQDQDIVGTFGLVQYGTESPPCPRNRTTDLAKHYEPDDLLPWHELPECYQRCMETNCCNGYPNFGDVREWTVEEFCYTERRKLRDWIHYHYQWCLRDLCGGCRPKCRTDADLWERKTCGYDD